jgi:membrane protease YdiL (CAAX protease family)
MRNNIFESNNKTNRADVYLIGMMTVLIVVFIIGYLQSSSLQNFGTIYFYLSIFVLILIIASYATRFKIFSFVIYGKEKNKKSFFLDVIIGIVLGLILNLGIIGLTIGIPLSINGTISSNNLVNYIVIAFFGVLVEELFWIGTFVPTFLNFLISRFSVFIAGLPIVLSILILFLSVEYIGAFGIVLTLIILIFASIMLNNKVFNKLNKYKINKFVLALIAGVILIVSLHVYAYGNLINNWMLFLSAGIFFTIEGIVDYFRQSIIPSILMHTVNNAIIGASVLSIGLIYGLPASIYMIAIMVLFLYVLFITNTKKGERSLGINKYFKSYY